MGGGDLNGDSLEAAKRELKEETGLVASKWTNLGRLHTSNSVTDEVGYMYLAEDLILETTKEFLGEIDQKPPVFSAIKKDGIRLYEHARAGEEVEIASRKTTIYEFEITRIALPEIDFRVKCSKGTYIRSLAFDFGIALKSGGYLSALRRTKIGDYSVEDGITPEMFEEKIKIHET